ncbi:MAG: hypothetical protein IJS04_04140 [Muribaculaceae bacterium]|nr:hypothetical protein [Muribaculaceae bacterium]
MKKSLSELTLAEFIDMECGYLDVLRERHEVANPKRLAKMREHLSNEFQRIASPSSYKSMIIDKEKKDKLRMKSIFFGTLKSLVDADALDEVRNLLTQYGVDCSRFDDDRLRRDVSQRLNSINFELKRMGLEKPKTADVTPEDIRRGYEDMVADLMIINKMSIDMNTILASVFASMVRKANEMAKALNSKLKNTRK